MHHSATFHNCIDLKTVVVGKQLMICVHVTNSAKGHSMQSRLEKATSIRSTTHTCTWLSVCIHVAACLQLCLLPPASPPSHTLIVCPNVCMPVRPDVCVLPGLAKSIIHNTMPSHIRIHESVCICVCKCICASTYAHKITVDWELSSMHVHAFL